MSEDLTRFYDQPPLKVRLVGGPSDGTDFYVAPQDPPNTLRVPFPERWLVDVDADMVPPSRSRVCLYEFRGSISDDGVRRYAFAGGDR